ncbi:DUF2339 domain-containing protein [Nocardia jinanensis]|uniref:DUF2339 domain-containing protein n=1 Tax=Nocardia jinanensis TaxID=382504 RepID=A0A917VP80_9NOCA|nr:DUF2339 domain-containing protein [Nocardia jinanensis]GGL03902.1 hypothetical protein GCM10011588_18180 [Nocardia jinanensis]
MTTSIDPALVARLSGEFTTIAGDFTALGGQLSTLGRDLEVLHRQVRAAAPAQSDAEAAPTVAPGSVTRATPESAAREPVPQPATPDVAGTPGVRVSGPADHPTASGAPAPAHPAPAPWGVPAHTTPQLSWPVPPPRPHGRYAGAYPIYRNQPAPPPGPPRRGPTRLSVPRTPWWQREGVISRVLAVAGVAVTLIGVVMLLVLAAQAGIFGPVPRVVAGAVFSAILVGSGIRVFRRTGGRVGGIALAATGFAGAYLDVVATTTIYDWLHPVPGFAVALGVAAAGVGLAVQWRSQALAVLVVAGAAVLAPFVSTELSLLAFLIVLQLACVPVQYRHDWPFLHLVRTVPPVLATQIAVVAAAIGADDPGRSVLVLMAAVAVAVVGLAGTLVVVRHRPGDIVATLTFALATTPLLAAPALFDRPAATVISSVYAVILLALAATPLLPKVRDTARIPGHTAIVAAVAGSFALLETCWGVTTAATLPLGLFLVAGCYLAIAGRTRSRVAAALGAGHAALGGLAFLGVAGPGTLATEWIAVRELSAGTAASAIAGLGMVVVALWGSGRLAGPAAPRRPGGSAADTRSSVLWIGAGAAALYLVTAATVSLGVLADNADGFVIGHSIATIVWMAGALAALLYGLRSLSAETPTAAKVALGSGLLVTAAALAKLFLFDLATLDGLIRVTAFLVVGVLLLIAGTRYARAFAETGARDDESPSSAESR